MLAVLALVCMELVTGPSGPVFPVVIWPTGVALKMPWRRVNYRSAGQQVWPQIQKKRTAMVFGAGVLETALVTFFRRARWPPLAQGPFGSAGEERVGGRG